MSAKNLIVRLISSQEAAKVVKKWHYSRTTVRNSQLHFGVFWAGKLEGAIQFGPSFDKKKVASLVRDTTWNGFIEINRMAFSPALPRNSESRAIAISLRLIKKNIPEIKWVVSYADGTQSGDGAIYRASGFLLTQIKINKTIVVRPDGTIGSEFVGGIHVKGEPLAGYQLRYLYFFDEETKQKSTVPILPFSEIDRVGARMYRGVRRGGVDSDTLAVQAREGGAIPTPRLIPT